MEDFGIGINDFRAEISGDAVGGTFDLLELSGEIAGGGGDGGDAHGCTIPYYPVIHFCDGEVEAVPEFVFHGAEDLATVFEGLGGGDLEFDGEFGYRHKGWSGEYGTARAWNCT
jgi:hypothetical protein